MKQGQQCGFTLQQMHIKNNEAPNAVFPELSLLADPFWFRIITTVPHILAHVTSVRMIGMQN